MNLALLPLMLLCSLASAFELDLDQEVTYLPASEIENQSIEPVTVDEAPTVAQEMGATPLRILGRGVYVRKTGESLALACIGQNSQQECEQLQFVYFSSATAPARYIGSRFKVPVAPTEKLQRKSLRLVIQEYLDYHMTPKSAKKRLRAAEYAPGRIGSVVMVGGVVMPLITRGYMAGQALIVGAGYVLPLIAVTAGVVIFVHQYSITKLLSSGLVVSDLRFTEQDGWNWSSNPRAIRRKKFEDLKLGLLMNTPTEYVEAFERHYKNKKKKLSKTGVKF